MESFLSGNRHGGFRRWIIAAGIFLLFMYRVCVASGMETDRKTDILDLHAAGAVLMDGYTGRILYEKNGFQVLPMASTTKIMTCITALEYGDPEASVEVSAYAASMPDVQLGICCGEKYRLGDLLLSLMLESHNDSAVAIAEYIAAEASSADTQASQRSVEESKALVADFADLMNQKAQDIGCENTYFITPNGLDAEEVCVNQDGNEVERFHSTTAAELALIMRYCLSQSEKSDAFVELTRMRNAEFTDGTGKRSFSCTNHNRYLDMNENAVSGKTGFTGKAGYCYVGAVKQNGVFLIVSLLACGWPPSKNLKWKDMNTLVDYGLENYTCVQVSKITGCSGSYLISDNQGKKKRLFRVQTRIAAEPFKVLLNRDEQLTEVCYLDLNMKQEGEVVGEYCILAGNEVCRTFPVIIQQIRLWENK